MLRITKVENLPDMIFLVEGSKSYWNTINLSCEQVLKLVPHRDFGCRLVMTVDDFQKFHTRTSTLLSKQEESEISSDHFTLNDLKTFKRILNEVCNGINIPEFEITLQNTRSNLCDWLQEFKATINKHS
jgi:hypothetical protein